MASRAIRSMPSAIDRLASRYEEMRRRQFSFGDGPIAEEVGDLREDWMKHADEVLGTRTLSWSCTRRWRNGIPTAVAAADGVHQPTWCCGC